MYWFEDEEEIAEQYCNWLEVTREEVYILNKKLYFPLNDVIC